ncbi:hypothetical protein [Streptomyces sp. NPDC056061]|uniref:hypothetical protein n=1 Tax=Streptomyces sp. NPDC056061 TaxID=3345700 RepID=UPI0035DDC41A
MDRWTDDDALDVVGPRLRALRRDRGITLATSRRRPVAAGPAGAVSWRGRAALKGPVGHTSGAFQQRGAAWFTAV